MSVGYSAVSLFGLYTAPSPRTAQASLPGSIRQLTLQVCNINHLNVSL